MLELTFDFVNKTVEFNQNGKNNLKYLDFVDQTKDTPDNYKIRFSFHSKNEDQSAIRIEYLKIEHLPFSAP